MNDLNFLIASLILGAGIGAVGSLRVVQGLPSWVRIIVLTFAFIVALNLLPYVRDFISTVVP